LPVGNTIWVLTMNLSLVAQRSGGERSVAKTNHEGRGPVVTGPMGA
jgi:hypothetical protein